MPIEVSWTQNYGLKLVTFYLKLTFAQLEINFTLRKIIWASTAELERVPDPTRRPGPEEKLSLNAQYQPGSNFGKARKRLGWLHRAQTMCRNALHKSKAQTWFSIMRDKAQYPKIAIFYEVSFVNLSTIVKYSQVLARPRGVRNFLYW